MNKVISDSFINSHLLELIEKSEKYLVLVSPYLKLWGHLETQLENSIKRGVDVKVYYRSSEEKKYKTTYDKLTKMGLKVYKIDTLHSKLYLSEKEGLMTSMNLLDFSKSILPFPFSFHKDYCYKELIGFHISHIFVYNLCLHFPSHLQVQGGLITLNN